MLGPAIPRQRRFRQRVERFQVCEKIPSASDEQFLEEQVQLVRVPLQQAQVLQRPPELVHADAPLDAPADGAGLIERKIVPDARAQEHNDFLEQLERSSPSSADSWPPTARYGPPAKAASCCGNRSAGRI